MSSYNENLNASVATSLQAQELKLSTTQAQLNAGMFTLYYAEDAKITAQEKLKKTEDSYENQEIINEEAVANKNICINLVATANQEKEINSQAVSNTAVAAANVQIATNAITKLASDMGSIVSILNAADYGSQIYDQAYAINLLMNDTAYNAEVNSQKAMEASSLTAEITASTVADIATQTATSITDLLTTLNTQLDATTSLLITENSALASAATDQKKAEGELIDSKVDYNAVQSSYIETNKELNLSLQVNETSNTGFTVQFNFYTNPFLKDAFEYPSLNQFTTNAVESYYIFIVKESEKTTFSLSTAEGLIGNNQIAIPTQNEKTELLINEKLTNNEVKYQDSNGDQIKLGENYVVFVLAQFTLDYKKSLNNFDDFLTAASNSFILTNQLNSPTSESISVTSSSNNEFTLQFDVIGNNKFPVAAYRCMFLPDNSEVINATFSTKDQLSIENQMIKEILNEIKTYETDEDDFYENLENLKNELNSLIESQQKLNDGIKATEEATSSDDDVTKKNDSDQNKKLDKVNKKINALQSQIQNLLTDQSNSVNNIEATLSSKNKTPQPGFFFNQLIAENVTDGNYILASSDQIIAKNTTTTTVTIPLTEDNITDNFGNPLIHGNSYIPVILTVASGSRSTVIKFSNSLSDFQNTATFLYKTKSTTTETAN